MVCARLFSWISSPPVRRFNCPDWIQSGHKQTFFDQPCPAKKKKPFVFDPSAAFAACQCFPPWPISSGECTRVCPNKHRRRLSSPFLLLHLTSAISPALCFFFFSLLLSHTAGSCSQRRLCTASFVVLVVSLIMCQVSTASGFLLSLAPFYKTQIAQTLQTGLCFSLRAKKNPEKLRELCGFARRFLEMQEKKIPWD